MAQIAQMVQVNRQNKGAGDIAYNFTHGSKIERIYRFMHSYEADLTKKKPRRASSRLAA